MMLELFGIFHNLWKVHYMTQSIWLLAYFSEPNNKKHMIIQVSYCYHLSF